jgi:cold shock protein
VVGDLRQICQSHEPPLTGSAAAIRGDDMTGTIKRLIRERAFGFLRTADGHEYYFHRSGTLADWDTLQEGDPVAFELEPSPKGPRAINVRSA